MSEVTVSLKYARQILVLASRYHAKESAQKIVRRYEAVVRGSIMSDGEAVAYIKEERAERAIALANAAPGMGQVDPDAEKKHAARERLWREEEAERRRLQRERKDQFPVGGFVSARSV